MAVYSQQKFSEDIQSIKKVLGKASRVGIAQVQASALQLAVAPPPSGITSLVFKAEHQTHALQALCTAIAGLQTSEINFTPPTSADVPAERVSPSSGTVARDAPVLLFVHGGGFIYGSPATARRTTRRLADLTRGTCIVPRYRKAPAHPFPAALLDLLCVYLSLLSPPAGAQHHAVPPGRIVFAGESSGLNALFALLQVILHLRARGIRSVRFHERDVPLDLPAAVTGMCGFFDVTCSLPSWSANLSRDVLPEVQPTYTAAWRDQPAWPTSPPRADVYCERSAMTHPLVSPVTAASWAGAPPLFVAVGDEMVLDSNRCIARLAAAQGVPVRFMQYEGMTHVWPAALPKLPHSDHALEAWAAAVRQCAEGGRFESSACVVSFDHLQEIALDIAQLTTLTRDDVLRMTKKGQQERLLVQRKRDPKM